MVQLCCVAHSLGALCDQWNKMQHLQFRTTAGEVTLQCLYHSRQVVEQTLLAKDPIHSQQERVLCSSHTYPAQHSLVLACGTHIALP